jgi:hypothetical protein
MSTCPLLPKKDPVQETVSALKVQQLKTPKGEDMTLHHSIWNNKTKEALLMHVWSTLDTIKKHGHSKDHDKGQALYVSQKEATKQAKVALALLDGVRKGAEKSKKSSKKAKEAEAQKCEQNSYWTSRRPRKLQRTPRVWRQLLQTRCSSSMQI